jgi:hypothetical protein
MAVIVPLLDPKRGSKPPVKLTVPVESMVTMPAGSTAPQASNVALLVAALKAAVKVE